MRFYRSSFSFLIAASLILSAHVAHAEDIGLPSDISTELRAKYNEGVELLNSGKSAAAAEKFSDLVRDLPSSAAAHMAYASALEAAGKSSQAVSEYETASTIMPDNEDVLYFLGRAYQVTGDRDKAIRQWDRYLWLYRDGKYASYVKDALPMLKGEKSKASVFADSKGRDDYLDETLSKGAFRWEAEKMPVAVFINDGAGVPGYKPAYDMLVRQAFADWEAATDGRLRFKPVTSPEQANIEVKWTGNPADFGNSTEAGEARPQTYGNHLQHVEILLGTKGLQGAAVQGLRGTALHEIGHAIGLSGHSSNREDIMFMMSRAEEETQGLSARDIKTAWLLYCLTEAQLGSYNKYVKNDAPFFHNAASSYERARAYFADGSVAYKNGRYLEAAHAWEQALEIRPDTVNFKINIGNAYVLAAGPELKAKNLAKAKLHLQSAVKYFKEASKFDQAVICLNMLALIAHEEKNEPAAKKLEAESAELKQKVIPAKK